MNIWWTPEGNIMLIYSYLFLQFMHQISGPTTHRHSSMGLAGQLGGII